MKNFRKSIFMCLAVICTLMFLSSPAFAVKAASELGGADTPPYGAVGDPWAPKMTGVFFVRYLDYTVDNSTGVLYAEGAQFSLRLVREKSIIPQIFYGETHVPLDFSNPEAILLEFYNALEESVEAAFFDGADMVFKIKTLSNEAVADVLVQGPPDVILDMVVLVDVEITARAAEPAE